jgi:hypothetical protein
MYKNARTKRKNATEKASPSALFFPFLLAFF